MSRILDRCEVAASTSALLEAKSEARAASRLQTFGVADIFAPLPPANHILEELDLAPGPPTMVAGFGFSGKTVAVQQLALAVASGTRVWNSFEIENPIHVLHVDYEQGSRLTFERYQRLAMGHGIKHNELGDRLRVAVMPKLRLSDRDAEDSFSRECEGIGLMIIDSLKAAAPSIEENSSDARVPLDMLGRVSERTGCAVIVIHHARKSSPNNSSDPRQIIRGSSAIFDACQSVVVLDAPKGEPVRISHAKARLRGTPHEEFALSIQDVASDQDPRAGLRLTVDDIERIGRMSREAHRDTKCEEVLAFVRQSPGCTTREVRIAVRGRNELISAVLDQLERTGAIHKPPGGKGWKPCGPGGVRS